MAITVDATGTGGTHVCGANANMLFAVVTEQGNPTGVQTVTYNGVSMTALTTQSYTNGSHRAFYMLNPPTGSHTVAVTTGADGAVIVTTSYNGNGGGIDAVTYGVNSTAGTGFTASNTSVADNCWTILLASAQVTGAISASTGATLRVNTNSTNMSAGIFDANSAKTPPGAVSEAVTFASARYGFSILSIKPLVPQTITDSMSMSESMKKGNVLTETITMATVYVNTFTEVITGSDTYLRIRRVWKNTTKNVSTWINNSKS